MGTTESPAAGAAARPSSAPAGSPSVRVLLVDDEPSLRRSLARVLLAKGFEVQTVEDGPTALGLLASSPVDVVLLDLMMPRMGGMAVLEQIKRHHAGVEVIMMTAFADVNTAVSAVRAGAYDFLTKPFPTNDAVALAVEKAAEHRRLLDRMRSLEQRLEHHERFGELVGTSPRMQEVYRFALGVAPTSSSVLITGENGTGKELVARAIHQHSGRAARPLSAVNCGAIPENLVETELFGSVRGAFTGAQDRPGLFETADKGTVFLDEIGDLAMLAQVKLLRVLAQGEVRRVGGSDVKYVDVRVIAATNVDLRERIQAGRFREDLFYRLNVIPIHLPPLRQRKGDIPLLAYHFLHKYARRTGRDVRRISVEAMKQLRDHPWPGNVRELENSIEHAVVIARGEAVMPADLPFVRARAEAAGAGEATSNGSLALPEELTDLPYTEAKDRAVDAFDEAYVRRVMGRTGGNISEAARQAGMDRSNFRRLVKKVQKRAGTEGDAEDD